jgi:hypothetical protein
MTTATLPSHDAIRWILQSTPWRIIGQHYAGHPIGLPLRDGYGNYVQTERVWLAPAPLGREAIGTASAAYVDITRSIHDVPTIDIGTACREVLRCAARVEQFPTRAAYVEAHLPYAAGADPVTIGGHWTAALDCALRADRLGLLAALTPTEAAS